MIHEFSLITAIFGFLTGFFGTTFITKNHHINFKTDLPNTNFLSSPYIL